MARVMLLAEKLSPLAVTLREATDLLDAINRQQGDLPLRSISGMQDVLHRAAVAAAHVSAELANDPDPTTFASSNAVLASRPGGPQTVAELSTAIAGVQAAADAYVASVDAMLAGWSLSWSKTTRTDAMTGVTTSEFALPQAIPAATANVWRIGDGVTGLLTALRAAGG